METITITGISSQGKGIGRLPSGQVVFVDGALPGETVRLQGLRKEKKIHLAELAEVIETHPLRQDPPCPLFGACGGCQLQHAQADLQAKLKERMVQDALGRIGGFDHPIPPILRPDKPFRYRNKGRFHAEASQGRVRLGFYALDSHDLIPGADCLLFSDQVNALIRFLEDALTATGRPDHVQKVLVRESAATGALMVIYVSQDQRFRAKDLPRKLAQAFPQVQSQWHHVASSPRLNLAKNLHHLLGEKTISDTIGPHTYALSPASFFQVHTQAAELLYDTAKAMTPWQEGATLLDLYSGIGTIGLHMADKVNQVIGVESIRAAVLDAKANAQANGVAHASFHHARAEAWLPKWVATGGQAQHVVLDPPRKGCDPKVLEAISKAGIPTITYISCNPATLARDIKILRQEGYEVTAVQPVDLFPQTSHVETIALLQREIS